MFFGEAILTPVPVNQKSFFILIGISKVNQLPKERPPLMGYRP
jgi:hypothetical protein